jgi:hypothetical protein
MAYNNFTLELAVEQFKLRLIDNLFCESLPAIDPKVEFLNIFAESFLDEALKETAPLYLDVVMWFIRDKERFANLSKSKQNIYEELPVGGEAGESIGVRSSYKLAKYSCIRG